MQFGFVEKHRWITMMQIPYYLSCWLVTVYIFIQSLKLLSFKHISCSSSPSMTHNLIFCPMKRMQWDKGSIQGFQMSGWQNHFLVPKARARVSAVEVSWALVPALQHGSLERITSSIWRDTFCYTLSLYDNCTSAALMCPFVLIN